MFWTDVAVRGRALLFLMAIFPLGASAATTGEKLLSLCESDKEILRNNCSTYINAFTRGLLLGQALSRISTRDLLEPTIAKNYGRPINHEVREKLGRMGRDVCLSAGIRSTDLVKVTQKYLSYNQQALKEPAQALIFRALRQAYPCR